MNDNSFMLAYKKCSIKNRVVVIPNRSTFISLIFWGTTTLCMNIL